MEREEWLTLNVGGTIMCTTRSTLLSHPGSVLARMFSSGLAPAARDDRHRYLLDRPAGAFGALLDWLRNGVIPAQVDRASLLAEAEFWGVAALVEQLRAVPDFADRGSLVRALLHPLREDGLVGARLMGLDLRNLVLEGIAFMHCNWQGCNLSGVSAAKTIFSGGKFSNAILDGAVLTSAAFSSCQMDAASCRRSNMQHAIIQKANCRGADFSGANLQDVHFQDSDLRDCIFEGANLENAHLAGADLRGATLDWTRLGESPFVRGVIVTEAEFNAIPRVDKADLKLRVLGTEEAASIKELRALIAAHEMVLFVLGFGSVNGDDIGDPYSNDAIKLARSLPFPVHVVDVVGNSALIDDLFFLCRSRSWPKVFYKGDFLGGHGKLVEFAAGLRLRR